MGKSKELATLTDEGGTIDGPVVINSSANDQFRITDGTQSLYIDTDSNGVAISGGAGQTSNGVYLYNSQDKVALHTNNALRMTIDASGRVTMPYQPAFWAHSNTYTSSGNYPFTNFSTSTGMFNRGGHLNLTTGVFTAPVAGIYQFNGVWHDTANSTSRKIGRFQLNGNSLGEFAEATDQYADVGASIVVSLAANDTMQVVTHPLAFGSCDFSGYLIG